MRVEIRHQGVDLSEATRQRLHRRLDFALGRVESHVSRVWAHVAATPDNRCRILVRLQQLPDVIVEDRSADLNVAIDKAVNRAGLAVRRELERRQVRR